jgi:hypothetical protein
MKIWRIRLARLDGGRNRHGVVDRHIAPAQHDLAFSLHRAFQFLFAGQTRSVFLRQEDHANAIFTVRRQHNALLGHFLTIETVRNLDQDARAVAHQRIGAHSAPVVEVFENLQALLDDLVAFLALDVSDEADAAGVMFVLRVVQTLRGGNRVSRLLVVVHGDTVCEGPDRPLNRFSIAAVRTATTSATSYA